MMTFLPPISRWTFLNDGAACADTVRPTSVDPVNDTTRTSIADEQRVADVAAAAGDEVDDAARDAGLFEDLDEVERRERRQRRRLEHDGVAADQRRDDLPRRDRHRKIPRRDDRADAERLTHRHRELVAQLGRHGLAVLAPPFARHEEGHVDRFLDVAARFVEDLAHLARHVARERLLALGEQLRGAEQHLGALAAPAPAASARRRAARRRSRAATSAACRLLETGRSDRRCSAGFRFSNTFA